MDEGVLVFVAVIAMVGASLFAAKGCNDSDNEVFTKAVQAGCDIVQVEHHGRQIICTGKDFGDHRK